MPFEAMYVWVEKIDIHSESYKSLNYLYVLQFIGGGLSYFNMVSWVTTAIFQGILHYLTIFYSDLVIFLKAGAVRVFSLYIISRESEIGYGFRILVLSDAR